LIRIIEIFFGEKKYDLVMEDCKFILLFIGAQFLLLGSSRSLFDLKVGLPFLSLGAVFLAAGTIPNYFVRLVALVGFTALLWLDFARRLNPFAIVYSLAGVYHVYLLLTQRPDRFFRKKTAMILLGFLIATGWTASLFAEDYIEIRGRGVYMGKLIKETKTTVTFQDLDGVVETFDRKDVLLLEKNLLTAKERQQKQIASSTPAKPVAAPPTTPAAAPAGEAPKTNNPLKGLDPKSLPKDPQAILALLKKQVETQIAERVESKDILTQINVRFEKILASHQEFFTPDKESLANSVLNSITGIASRGMPTNVSPVILVGYILSLGAFLFILVYGVWFIVNAFQAGVSWGFLVLAQFASGFILQKGGEPAILAVHLLGLAFFYFVLTRWNYVRVTMVRLAFSLNVLIAGFLIIKHGLFGF